MWKKEEYDIFVSTRKDKKYDVYQNNKHVCSFGSKHMEHYKDLLGAFSKLDHNDEQRRKNFKSRFRRLIAKNDKTKGIYWSNKYLW